MPNGFIKKKSSCIQITSQEETLPIGEMLNEKSVAKRKIVAMLKKVTGLEVIAKLKKITSSEKEEKFGQAPVRSSQTAV
ncbi:Hypothetical protein NTJ_12414 [Nesidiocoris tenuis]|uniref:Uncharacterized protein n=1 Tax=Nesidiocoris tenuis TaxID=355587 RepID=A0ABN7B5B2_9HEMI|nr:Hypothetical protein NTJ_12414 [Nesidiocoris tenuis]